MSLQLFAHPFSSYCWKVLIALRENGTPFEMRILDQDHPENGAEWAALWPLRKMPVLADDGRAVVETSAIIEHLQLFHPGPVRLLPDDPAAAVEVRMLDRIFDDYVMTPMIKVVGDALRPAEVRDPTGVAEARAMLDTAYGWLDTRLAGRVWAAGDTFSLADCAGAPALFYADRVQPIPRGLSGAAGLSRTRAGATVGVARGGGGTTAPPSLPLGSARPGLTHPPSGARPARRRSPTAPRRPQCPSTPTPRSGSPRCPGCPASPGARCAT